LQGFAVFSGSATGKECIQSLIAISVVALAFAIGVLRDQLVGVGSLMAVSVNTPSKTAPSLPQCEQRQTAMAQTTPKSKRRGGTYSGYAQCEALACKISSDRQVFDPAPPLILRGRNGDQLKILHHLAYRDPKLVRIDDAGEVLMFL